MGSSVEGPALAGSWRIAETFCHYVDIVNERVGKAASMLFIPLIFVVSMEVALRYLFSSPTLWAWDVNTMIMCGMAVLGAGYTLLKNGHVVVDVIYHRFSPRTRAILDLITSVVAFIGLVALSQLATSEAIQSVQSQEHWSSTWRPPIYPLRIVVAVGFILILLQAVAKFIRDLASATRAKEMAK